MADHTHILFTQSPVDDITEILLMLKLNTNQSINQSTVDEGRVSKPD